jgi:hypothetical protein
MNFEKSKHYNFINSKNSILPFGTLYFFDYFCISEINEGVHLGLDECQEILISLVDYYGDNLKIAFISNRINSYSVEPRLWMNFQKDYEFIVANAIISYNDFSYMNSTIEKRFSQNSLKRCHSINEAIEWVLDLKEFNQNSNDLPSSANSTLSKNS